MNLVLIETSSNQHYIFSTNKLRENIGASELTYRVGTKTVLNAIKVICGLNLYAEDLKTLQHNLLDKTKNKPIGINDQEVSVEVIIATSGKAILLTKDEGTAKKIIGYVTKHALIEMPGLTVHGAIVDVEDDLTDIHDAVGKVHHRLEEVRYQIPSNQQRFQRLPFVEQCATSGLPANKIYRHESLKDKSDENKPHSTVSIKKQEKSTEGKNRLENTIKSAGSDVKLPSNISQLEKAFPKTQWLAVIHADGNGLGEIFLKFDKYIEYPNNEFNGRTYINQYRKFSVALDECTINATVHGLKNIQKEVTKPDSKHFSGGEVPCIPLILGGDDLTVICDGEYAIKFTHDFLTEFENQTGKTDIQDGIIPAIAQKAFGVPRLGICAGVAIIKPNYPFHQAYGLAENLIKSAKSVKTKLKHTFQDADGTNRTEMLPASAMDFHVLYDSSGVELKQIREKLEINETTGSKTHLFAKPYIVTNKNKLKENLSFEEDNKFKNKWLENRTWDKLDERVCAMKDKDEDGKNKLPNSRLHHIRESLFRGKQETDSEVNLFRHRYQDMGFNKLLCKEDLLFFEQDGVNFTHFLDALDVVELWGGFQCPKTDVEVQEENGGRNEK